MDIYINAYCSDSIARSVYSYVGWNELRQYECISDDVWRERCNMYCEDRDFKLKFDQLCANVGWMSWKGKLLNCMNDWVKEEFEMAPRTLRDDRDFVWHAMPDIDGLHCVKEKWRKDRELLLQWIKNCNWVMEDIDPRLFLDRAWMLEAVKVNGNLLHRIN